MNPAVILVGVLAAFVLYLAGLGLLLALVVGVLFALVVAPLWR